MPIQFLDIRTSQAISNGVPSGTGSFISDVAPGTFLGGIGVITKGALQQNKNDIRVQLRLSAGVTSEISENFVTFRVYRISNGVTTLIFQGNQVVPPATIIAGIVASDFQPPFPTNGQIVYQTYVQANLANVIHLDGPVSFNGTAATGTSP
ncbi:hypothetical protein [Marininema halotolerans]|uniref:Exosporium protein C n=1 Tax=Marininema halotolerans TaxID=1155944 RepID=A0A1I6TP33_9BACL|nr:hypothetical protein [Marininema halotolerans]SFS90727.1 hypothetical protein SAMN05444972_110163 [Marininema halotolerans]